MKLFIINQLNNINNLIAITHYKPDSICLISDTQSSLSTFEDFKDYLTKNRYDIETREVNLSTSKQITDLLSKSQQSPEDHYFVLPTNGTVIGYQIISWFSSPPLTFILVENDGDIFEYINGSFDYISDTSDIDVSDFINIRGGRITSDLSDLFDHQGLNQLLFYIEQNISTYHKLFKHEVKKKFFQSDPNNNAKLYLYPNQLKDHYKNFLFQLVKKMEQYNIIKVDYKTQNKITLEFTDYRYKSYLLKTGTWLEHKLYQIFKEMNLDDVKASLSFIWDTDTKANNEFDVAAVYSNSFIMASCKATSHLEPDYVNEVVANTIHMGDKTSVKIIFTTAKVSNSLAEKAKEFNVAIVQYSKNTLALKKELFELLS